MMMRTILICELVKGMLWLSGGLPADVVLSYSDDDELPNASQVSLPYDRPEYSRGGPSTYSGDAPLTSNAQMPAGHGQGQIGDRSARNMSMLDEEDEEMTQARARLAAMQARKRMNDGQPVWAKAWTKTKRLLKRGPRVYEGDRHIHIGNPALNASYKYPGNSVSTAKYNLVTFLPKFLAGEISRVLLAHDCLLMGAHPSEQFSKYANIFFLFTACIQQIPNVSPTNRYTTIAPLSLVLLVAAMKEAQEDIVGRKYVGMRQHRADFISLAKKRHQSDAELNARKAKVLNSSHFEDKPWRSIKVGDIVRLESNDFFPADLVLLSSSEPEGLCYIETSNLDG